MNRREYNKFFVGVFTIFGIAYGVIKALPERVKPISEKFIEDPGRNILKSEIVDNFQNALPGELMLRYAMFYGPQRKILSVNMPKELEQAVSKVDSINNYHRLQALPAAAAAHLLGEPINPEKRYSLIRRIGYTLKEPESEVREIVLQNLLTSLSTDSMTQFSYDIDRLLLDIGSELINDSLDSPKLIMPLCHYIQYMLNLKLLLERRNTQPELTIKIIKKIDETLISICTQTPCPPQLWYAKRIFELYKSINFPHKLGPGDLPLQLSESLIGWENLSKKYSQYRPLLEHFALIRTRNLYSSYNTAIGHDSTDPKVLSMDRATRQMRQGTVFHVVFDFAPLLQEGAKQLNQGVDDEFRQFLDSPEANHLLERPAQRPTSLDDFISYLEDKRLITKEIFETSELEKYLKRMMQQKELGRFVPFAASNEKLILQTLNKISGYTFPFKDTENLVDNVIKYGGGLAGFMVGLGAFFESILKLVEYFRGRPMSKAEKDIIETKKKDIEETGAALGSEIEEGMESQETKMHATYPKVSQAKEDTVHKIVYVTRSGKCYHISSKCPSLKVAKTLKAIEFKEVENEVRRPCKVCKKTREN